jgi:hypothetical protein
MSSQPDRKCEPEHILWSALAVMVSLSVVGVVIAGWYYPPHWNQTLRIELFKSAMQLLGTAALGSAVTLLTTMYNNNQNTRQKNLDRDRERAQAKRQLQEKAFRRLLAVFVETKKHRRILIATGLEGGYEARDGGAALIKGNVYDEQMRALNDVELDLETLYRELETDVDNSETDRVFSQACVLKCSVREMKEYLRALLHQWQAQVYIFSEEQPTQTVNSLKHANKDYARSDNILQDFIDEKSEDEKSESTTLFYTEYVKKYRVAAKAMQNDLITPIDGTE